MKKIELLPKGKFSLTQSPSGSPLEGGECAPIRGQFSMYAIDRFCLMTGVDNYFQLVEKIVSGMSVGDYARLLQCALNENRPEDNELTTREVMGIFDDVFDGMEDPDFIALLYHAIGRISIPASTAPGHQEAAPEQVRGDAGDEEKKSDGLTETNLSATPLRPV